MVQHNFGWRFNRVPFLRWRRSVFDLGYVPFVEMHIERRVCKNFVNFTDQLRFEMNRLRAAYTYLQSFGLNARSSGD